MVLEINSKLLYKFQNVTTTLLKELHTLSNPTQLIL